MEEQGTKLVVVLGMHRSGTSVITRGLQVMGVQLGDRLMPPFDGNNSKGFWEDMDINDINIEMLSFLKSDWHFLTPIQPSDVDTLCKSGYLQRAVELLKKKTAGVKAFGFKDPRVAKLLPFWKEVFAYGQWTVHYVLVIRHPLSVCQSLAKRDGFEFEKSNLLWLEHVIGSLVGTEGENRVLVDYDYFMQTPETELNRIAKGLELPIHGAELQNFRLEFLDPKLQHTIYQRNDLALETTLSSLVQEVYISLWESAVGNILLEDLSLSNKIVQWGKEFSHMRPALMIVDRLSLRIAAMAAELNRSNAEKTALSVERDALLVERAQLMQALKEKERFVQQLNGEVRTIYQSRSWRWTQPMRELFKLFRR